MLSKSQARPMLLAALCLLLTACPAWAQRGGGPGGAPPSIQFFMPDGSLPTHEIRFTLESDAGRVETFFSDSKGKFLLSRVLGMKSDAGYQLTVTSDGTSYATTTTRFKEYGVYYISVFLLPLRRPAPKPAGVVDLAEFDVLAPDNAREVYQAAWRAYQNGQFDEAVRGLERALKIYPNYFRALNDLGVIYMRAGRLEPAAQMFERAMKVAPRVYHPRLNLALIQARRGKNREAVTLLEPLLKENPTIGDAHIAMADALVALRQTDEAEAHYRAALGVNKAGQEAAGDLHYKLGLLLNQKQDYKAAAAELRLAAEALPDSPKIHLQLGGALLQMNELDGAERALLAAYRLGGAQMGGAQLMLGQVYFAEKKYPAARQAFRQYLIDVPQAPNRAEVEGVIEKINAALGSN
ncbi:MAG TPA: tetratricopeptide repeat protein [Blastocatellia bacterium]|nr:tetratricopeptide repeat protein [Blastocatellia bacterium]